MVLRESGQMYLESVLVLSEKDEPVRSLDVANHLGFSKPSVSRAVGLLRDGGYLTVGKDGGLSLTEAGLEVAERTYERHTVLSELFMKLGVSEENAVADACKMEHIISVETFAALKKLNGELE